MGKTAFKKLQQTTGFTFCSGGLLFSERWRRYFDPVDSTYIDSMHCIYASGGVFQYQANELLYEVLQLPGMTLTKLDDFKNALGYGGRRKHYLGKTWFKDRYSPDGYHMKAFASEMVSAAYVLQVFAERVLAPAGQLPRHVELLRLLCNLTDILTLGDAAVEKVDDLAEE
eukprot:7745522-Karenia_brevis.AAC.1